MGKGWVGGVGDTEYSYCTGLDTATTAGRRCRTDQRVTSGTAKQVTLWSDIIGELCSRCLIIRFGDGIQDGGTDSSSEWARLTAVVVVRSHTLPWGCRGDASIVARTARVRARLPNHFTVGYAEARGTLSEFDATQRERRVPRESEACLGLIRARSNLGRHSTHYQGQQSRQPTVPPTDRVRRIDPRSASIQAATTSCKTAMIAECERLNQGRETVGSSPKFTHYCNRNRVIADAH